MRLWDADTSAFIAVLHGHTKSVWSVAFGPDGILVTANGDGTVRLTRCAACGPMSEVRAMSDSRVTRSLTANERRTYLHEPARA